jgi:hypothetical protein
MRHHIGQGIGRPADAADMLHNVLSIALNTNNSYGRGRIQPDAHIRMTDPGTFPEERAVPPHLHHHAVGKCVMVPAEGSACTTQAFVKDLNLVFIDGGKNLPAGTLRECGQGGIPGRGTPLFLLTLDHTPFINETVYPVLCSTPGNSDPVLDIGDGEGPFFEGIHPHQMEKFPSPFNDPAHENP